jgi:hypothetical protein
VNEQQENKQTGRNHGRKRLRGRYTSLAQQQIPSGSETEEKNKINKKKMGTHKTQQNETKKKKLFLLKRNNLFFFLFLFFS